MNTVSLTAEELLRQRRLVHGKSCRNLLLITSGSQRNKVLPPQEKAEPPHDAVLISGEGVLSGWVGVSGPRQGSAAVGTTAGAHQSRSASWPRVQPDDTAVWPEVTKRPDFTHKRTNHELRRSCERHRARP